MKEELKKEMIGVIGSYSNALIESIAERCAQVAIDFYEKRGQALHIHGVSDWVAVSEGMPDSEVKVLCYHEYSGNFFICYRTLDCLTKEPKWFGGAMPTHWKKLAEPPYH